MSTIGDPHGRNSVAGQALDMPIIHPRHQRSFFFQSQAAEHAGEVIGESTRIDVRL